MKRRLILLVVFIFLSGFAMAQQIKPVCAYCNRSSEQISSSGHAPSCPYYVAPKKSQSGVMLSPSSSMKMMVTTTILQGLISGIFSSDQQQKQKEQQKKLLEEQQKIKQQQEMALQKKIKDSMDHLAYLKLMSSYKLLQGSSKLDMKQLDGGMESMAAGARNLFESGIQVKDTGTLSAGTPFFGTKMDSAKIMTLIEPDKDTVLADVDAAEMFLRESKKADSVRMAAAKSDSITVKKITEGEKQTPDCEKLQTRLHSYLTQKEKFYKTVLTTQKELAEWKQKNTDALWNAATSGFEFAFGQLLSNVSLRGVQAENIRGRLIKYEEALRAKGVDVDRYLSVLNQRIFTANNLAKDVSEFKDAMEYDAFFRDAVQISVSKIAETDTVYDGILKDTTVRQLLNDGGFVEVDAGQFVAAKTFEKLLSSNFLKNLKGFSNKVPYVAYGQLAVDMIYHATDWYQSYQRITQLREVSGQETRAAMSLQLQIDKTFSQLKDCPMR